MSKVRLVIADADALIALSSKVDANHEKAKDILQTLTTTQANVLFPITAICEAVAAIRRKFNNPEAARHVVEQVQSENFLVQTIEKNPFFHALTLFNPHGSKRNTIFDAVVAALAKELHADAIFSFDEWYEKQGFTLASNLLPAEPQQEEPEPEPEEGQQAA